eukprot:COSAG02_NODE_1093_length_14617_cov_13.078661_7_plen_49_part_00
MRIIDVLPPDTIMMDSNFDIGADHLDLVDEDKDDALTVNAYTSGNEMR